MRADVALQLLAELDRPQAADPVVDDHHVRRVHQGLLEGAGGVVGGPDADPLLLEESEQRTARALDKILLPELPGADVHRDAGWAGLLQSL